MERLTVRHLHNRLHLWASRRGIDARFPYRLPSFLKPSILVSKDKRMRRLFMNQFIDNVRPLLFSEDVVLRHAWLRQLHDYPAVPVSLVNELVKFAETHEETQEELLIQLENSPKDKETLTLLARGVRNVPFQKRNLVVRFLLNVTPKLLVQFKEEYTYFIGKDYIETCERIIALEQTIDEEFEPLWEMYGELCNKAENEYNLQNMALLKHVLNALIYLGEYDASEAHTVLKDEMEEPYFSMNGAMAIYAAGVMRLEDCIPQFVELIKRESDDLLNPILEEAMIQMQSDQIVKALAPFVTNPKNGLFISVNTVLKETKSEQVDQILRDAYMRVADVEMKEFLLDALICSYSKNIFPFIEDFLAQGKLARAFDMEELFYGYYKAMGEEHALLETWRADIVAREESFKKDIDLNDLKFIIREQMGKVGRNDPCICGSGKKFKKCCGKGL